MTDGFHVAHQDGVEPIGDLVELADRVVMRFIWPGVGHGLTTKMEMTSVFTLRGRRVVFWEMFREHADALEAAGRPD